MLSLINQNLLTNLRSSECVLSSVAFKAFHFMLIINVDEVVKPFLLIIREDDQFLLEYRDRHPRIGFFIQG